MTPAFVALVHLDQVVEAEHARRGGQGAEAGCRTGQRSTLADGQPRRSPRPRGTDDGSAAVLDAEARADEPVALRAHRRGAWYFAPRRRGSRQRPPISALGQRAARLDRAQREPALQLRATWARGASRNRRAITRSGQVVGGAGSPGGRRSSTSPAAKKQGARARSSAGFQPHIGSLRPSPRSGVCRALPSARSAARAPPLRRGGGARP